MHRLDKVIIYTDGAARGNPGPSASGFRICDAKGRQIKGVAVYNGDKTNNFAEYNAVIRALEWCKENIENHKGLEIRLFSDSELVVRQINGRYKVKTDALRPLNEKAKRLSQEFKYIVFDSVPREHSGIKKVDSALNALLDKKEGEARRKEQKE